MPTLQTKIFGLTAEDLQKKIQPCNQEEAFSIADENGSMTVADAISILQGCEDTALELTQEAIYRLTQSIAEVLIDSADGGETNFRTSLYPLTKISLYKNYSRAISWNQRGISDKLPSDSYSVDMTTGEIVLATPLECGDRLYCEYSHSACTSWESIKADILALAAYEISLRFEAFSNANSDFQKSAETARYNLKDRKRIAGLPEIKFVTNSPFSSDFYAPIQAQSLDESVPIWWS